MITKLHVQLQGTIEYHGNRYAIKESALVDYSGGLIINECVTISHNVTVYTHTHRYHNAYWQDIPIKENEGVIPTPLVLEEYVFIGTGAIILGGVSRIGKCSVIGAGSIVTKTVPAFEIWAGNPAKKIGDVINNEKH
jgi:acetyltransferase-like isoleucine patch superfamily enzyme